MSVFENAMKSHSVLENDPFDWEKCDSEDMLTITAAATTAQQLTRLTPAYLGYLQPKKAVSLFTYSHLYYSLLYWSFAVSLVLFKHPSLSAGQIYSCSFLRQEFCTVRDP